MSEVITKDLLNALLSPVIEKLDQITADNKDFKSNMYAEIAAIHKAESECKLAFQARILEIVDRASRRPTWSVTSVLVASSGVICTLATIIVELINK